MMKRFKSSWLWSLLLLPTTNLIHCQTLDISPVQQATPVWCWVAVSEMVFEYYDVPNVNPARGYQCGVVGLLAAGTAADNCNRDCLLCTVKAGSAQWLISTLEDYPKRVSVANNVETTKIRVTHLQNALSKKQISSYLSGAAPIIAGITPHGRTQGQVLANHVVLIVGIDITEAVEATEDTPGSEETAVLTVNDPYPYGPGDNPYIYFRASQTKANQYEIDYDSFLKLNWSDSYIPKKVGVNRPPPPPPSAYNCCYPAPTPMGVASCPLNLSGPLPLGQQCFCNLGYYGTRYGITCN